MDVEWGMRILRIKGIEVEWKTKCEKETK